MIAKVLVSAGIAIALSAPILAETAAPKQKTASPTATLYRVDEGMFDLRAGEMIELTDRKITIHVDFKQNLERVEENQRINGTISGDGVSNWSFTKGKRTDLKNDVNATRKVVKDKAECYLDLVGITIPKGAPLVATFRFECN